MTETGTIIWFDWAVKRYGFIRRDLGGRDAHVHWRDVAGRIREEERGRFVAEPSAALQKDDRVEFEVEDGPKGPRAKNVRILRALERGDPIVGMIFDLGLK